MGGEVSGSQIEQRVDEPILLANVMVADPPCLLLADHMYSLVSRNRSPNCVELAKALLGLHSSFDRSMILLQDIVQILDRSRTHPLFQFGTVTLYSTPDHRVIRLQTALGEQLSDVTQRERVTKIPAQRHTESAQVPSAAT